MSDDTIDAVEAALAAAVEGEPVPVGDFFRTILSATFFVPRRYQHALVSDAPKYPNDFIDVLGLQDKERVVVPIFSRADLVESWANTKFVTRELPFTEILKLVPDEWWICINPGEEIEKELSPWEWELLKGGDASIPALVDELCSAGADPGVSFVPPPAEFSPLQDQLRVFAATKPEISSLYVVAAAQEDPKAFPSLVVGVRTSQLNAVETGALQGELQAFAERAVIGAASMKVVMGGSLSDSMLNSVFTGFTPCYERRSKKSAWKGLFSFLSSKDTAKIQ